MKRVERGSNVLPKPRGFIEHVRTCKRCDHIVEFPEHKIGLNASYAHEAKKYNFRVIERDSWTEKSNRGPCGGLTYQIWDETKREDMDSCMGCCNHRGHDCDEPWTEARCYPLSVEISPFTICDMYEMELKRTKDGIVIVGPRGKYYIYGCMS